ncbi:ABC transporter ATP-binding protein [Chelativorans salis]|uniref:Sn-glycerol-3-phosphate ABC transporter ATP-binding protein UgpC n=1 Tax=Chelativorans salis TaxID=2978478 RepID=A0ABT2LU65_9HYPH|nr:sn-glycerol-3-phosphate ABC transporter ATP-binding protein UgpC [Chelativorans sp. EGI FJ00035]MCT7378054.1 sn-glycerol-3-phosphate ABC transporter ATP-binding protein UgpC [Chelativorans sp. EGI FJ00035]
MAHVQVNQLFKKYGELQVVHGVDFEIGDGEFTVLVGPSGCGKSTILRMIAGLESVTSGDIVINERVVNDIPPRDRDIAMVFQDYALYPHMSVRQNLGFGLKMRNASKVEIDEAVRRTADTLQIGALLHRKPGQLSGGQRQRVAIGRAIAREPQLFLFDEPLSNLDAKLRVEMRTQIKRLHMSFQVTSIYVTHDQTEAMTLADRIVVLRDGRIEQVGTPDDLYSRPANRFVAGFIGSPTMNFIDARLVAEGDTLWVEPTGGPRLSVPAERVGRYRPHAGRQITLGMRPEDFTNTWTDESRAASSAVPLDVTVDIAEPLGSDTLIFGRIGEAEIVCRVTAVAAPPRGAVMRLNAHMNHMHLFESDSGVAL